MKKTVFLLLALVLVIALPACAKKADSRASDSAYNAQRRSDNFEVISPQNELVLITREKAIGIALQEAGLTRDEVFDLDAELDREPYGTFWEVDFETKEREYSYDIKAETGEIAYKERERND